MARDLEQLKLRSSNTRRWERTTFYIRSNPRKASPHLSLPPQQVTASLLTVWTTPHPHSPVPPTPHGRLNPAASKAVGVLRRRRASSSAGRNPPASAFLLLTTRLSAQCSGPGHLRKCSSSFLLQVWKCFAKRSRTTYYRDKGEARRKCLAQV